MNAKDAKQIIQELIKEKWFQTNFGGGITEEALHRSITALDKEINPYDCLKKENKLLRSQIRNSTK